jgi:rare lipoprotein A
MAKSVVLAGTVLALLAMLGPAEAGRSRLYSEDGTASWYGPKYQGKPTASGEVFDMDAMSAAHSSLPFDTVVRVINLENGRSVRVRINDRTTPRPGHVIDLSAGAARALQIGESGVARVHVQEVGG